jgi:hypothetical protein
VAGSRNVSISKSKDVSDTRIAALVFAEGGEGAEVIEVK